ncbi:MAG: carboxylating nicotinate-nucleotide diphosphorylase [Candidatus Omnitrophota bacterium]|jgi:nicotinate-nucleotide pyrophosphorylase (carboxylating)|nr:carboxylating nicotinate-nucleotide diphosphorylase [Candidatus Omnitrophota bacterium]
MKLVKEKVMQAIMYALNEDVGRGDITSSLVFEKDENVIANIIVKEDCVLAGMDVTKWVFNAIDERIVLHAHCNDGAKLKKGKRVASVKGSLRNILAGERTALNFLGKATGIATLTNKFVSKIKGGKAEIFDTRKTTPGLRALEKYAVKIGGGCNHRMGLWDAILIKDNHLIGQSSKIKAIQDAVGRAKTRGYKDVEVEVDNLKEFKVALESGADIILLDNMKAEDLRKASKLRKAWDKKHRTKTLLEASGGIKLDNISKVAKTGIDRISIGFLTHSAPSIDFSLICQDLN